MIRRLRSPYVTLAGSLLLVASVHGQTVPGDEDPAHVLNHVVVQNSKIQLVFSNDHGLSLIYLGRPDVHAPRRNETQDPGTPRGFALERRSLWEADFYDPVGATHATWSPENTTYAFNHTVTEASGKTTLTMDWTGLVIDGTNDFDVQVVMELMDGAEVVEMSASVTTRTPDFAFFQLDLPRVSVRQAPAGQGPTWLVTPWAGGMVFRNPHQTLQLLPKGWTTGVPSLNAAEFWSFQYGGNPDVLLYMSTADPDYYAKNVRLQATDGRHAMVTLENFPEDHLVPGARTYNLPYQPVIGCLDGRQGWFGAAEKYRRWAKKNGLLGKPFRKRTDVDAVTNADFFLTCSVDPVGVDGVGDYTKVLDAVNDWIAFLNDCSTLPDCVNGAVTFDEALVLVTSWYGCQPGKRTGWFQWSPVPDTRLQDMLDQSPSTVHLFPYFQPNRIHDTDLGNAGLLTWAHIDESLTPKRTLDGDADPLTFNTELDTSSSGVVSFLTNEVVNNLQPMGWDGIFFDTWAQKDSRLEYSGNDGHSAGGGNFMATGIRTTAQNVRTGARVADPDFLFTVEHVSQDLIQHTDFALENRPAPLFYNFVTPGLDIYVAPVFGAVFQESVPRGITNATSPTITISEDIFKYLWALNFQYGLIPCMSNFDIDDAPTHPIGDPRTTELFRYLQRLYRFQLFKKEFFLLGRRLPDLPLTGITMVPHGSLWTSEPRYFFPQYDDDEYPSIFSSTWRNPDGHVAVALINWTAQAETFTLKFDAVADTSMKSQASYSLYEEKETGRVLLDTFTSPVIEYSGSVDEECIRVFTVE